MDNKYTACDFTHAREWVRAYGGGLFPTLASFQWFVRMHRDELLRSGEILIRRGQGGTLVGPGFGRLAVEITRREQQSAA